jgi:streptogramin lyase
MTGRPRLLARLLFALLGCGLAALTGATSGVAAKPGQRHATIIGTLAESSHPRGLAVAADGTVWYSGQRDFSLYAPPSAPPVGPFIGHLGPGGAPIETALAEGTAAGPPVAVPGGDVWFPEVHRVEGVPSSVEVVGFSSAGQTQAYPVDAGVTDIDALTTMGGDLWFSGTALVDGTERGVIGRVSLATAGSVSVFPLRPGCAAREALAATPDEVWFGEYCPGSAPRKGSGRAKLGAIEATGSISRLPLPKGERPIAVAAASDSDVWVGMANRHYRRPTNLVHLGAGGRERQIRAPGAQFAGMAIGPEGRLWFATSNRGLYYNQLASIGQDGSRSRPIAVGTPRSGNYGAEDLTTGPEGTLWFSANLAGFLGIGGGGGARLMENEDLERSAGVIGQVR